MKPFKEVPGPEIPQQTRDTIGLSLIDKLGNVGFVGTPGQLHSFLPTIIPEHPIAFAKWAQHQPHLQYVDHELGQFIVSSRLPEPEKPSDVTDRLAIPFSYIGGAKDLRSINLATVGILYALSDVNKLHIRPDDEDNGTMFHPEVDEIFGAFFKEAFLVTKYAEHYEEIMQEPDPLRRNLDLIDLNQRLRSIPNFDLTTENAQMLFRAITQNHGKTVIKYFMNPANMEEQVRNLEGNISFPLLRGIRDMDGLEPQPIANLIPKKEPKNKPPVTPINRTIQGFETHGAAFTPPKPKEKTRPAQELSPGAQVHAIARAVISSSPEAVDPTIFAFAQSVTAENGHHNGEEHFDLNSLTAEQIMELVEAEELTALQRSLLEAFFDSMNS